LQVLTASQAMVGAATSADVMSSLALNLKKELIKTCVSTDVRAGFGEKVNPESLVRSTVAAILAQTISSEIGGVYAAPEGIDYLTHKFFNVINGAVQGSIIGGNGGTTAGALAALTSSIIAEGAYGTVSPQVAEGLGTFCGSVISGFVTDNWQAGEAAAGLAAHSAVSSINQRLARERERQALAQQEAQRQTAQAAETEDKNNRAEHRKRDSVAKKVKARHKMTAEEREVAAAVDVKDFTQASYFAAEDAELSHLFAQTQQAEAEIAEATGCLQRPEGESGYRSPTIADTAVQNGKQTVVNKIAAFIPEKVKEGFKIAAEIVSRDYRLHEESVQNGGVARLSHELNTFTQLGRLADAAETAVDYIKSTVHPEN